MVKSDHVDDTGHLHNPVMPIVSPKRHYSS